MFKQTTIVLVAVLALTVSTAFELKKIPQRKPPSGRPSKAPTHEISNTNSSDCKTNGLTEDEVRQIVKEEIVALSANSSATPTLAANETTFRSTKIALIDQEGRRFDYDQNDAVYRDISSTMCSAAQLSASTASNQAAFVSAHNSLRSQLNGCTWKVPKPSTSLTSTKSCTAMAAQADSYTQTLKTSKNCALVHSTQAQRTLTFKLDDGTQVTNGYIGENLAYRSLCLSVGDTTNFNKYQAQYCANGWLYQDASNSWWSEIAAYSAANQGNFLSQAQLDTANSNSNTQVGHWTQMAWASSTNIAGAAAECSSVSTQTFGCSPPNVGGCSAAGTISVNARCFSWVVTGRYYQGGNIQGQNPYPSGGALCTPTSG